MSNNKLKAYLNIEIELEMPKGIYINTLSKFFFSTHHYFVEKHTLICYRCGKYGGVLH
jgi:hypothetical protein